MADVNVAKAGLRRRMRATRSALEFDRSAVTARSRCIIERLVSLTPLVSAQRIAGYRSLPGEVDTASLAEWCRAADIDFITPNATRAAIVAPEEWSTVDVVVLPGLAFTPDGRRLGQGGGWYDRMLAAQRPGFVVGLAFREQIVDDLPVDDHDVHVDVVVDDDGIYRL